MSSRCLNKVVLIGNVGEEPRLTYTNNGSPVCTFKMATNRSWRPQGASEKKEETQWHFVVAFSKLAEICSQILTKGTKVFVSGRLQTRRLTSQNGEKFKKVEVVARKVIGLDKRKTNQDAY